MEIACSVFGIGNPKVKKENELSTPRDRIDAQVSVDVDMSHNERSYKNEPHLQYFIV